MILSATYLDRLQRPATATATSFEEVTTSMVWKVKSISHRTTPAREREQTCATEAEFERAVKYAQAWTQLVSAIFDDGTVLDASELRRRYGPMRQPRST